MRNFLRAQLAVLVCLLLGSAGCESEPPPGVPGIEAEECVPANSTEPGLEDAVWGFADLHSHPGITKGFAPRGLVWGEAQRGQWNDPNVLDALQACPVESHDEGTEGPFDRTAHTLILPLLNAQMNFTHPPIGDARGTMTLDAWPNARDVLHQQMQVASIYRAYLGGLRLLFASVTDNQALAELIAGPHLVDAFASDRDREIASARAQLREIQDIVSHNPWMAVARCPREAREIIGSGRLAVVLSLEMEGLPLADMVRLIDVEQFPIAHIIAIHLIDNDFGGSAAFSDIFNASTALLSSMFGGPPLQYVRVGHTDRVTQRLGWPWLATETPDIPLLYNIGEVSLPWYQSLNYEDMCCAASRPTPVRLTGHMNAQGLSTNGESWIQTLMRRGIMVDVTHMGFESVADTIRLADSTFFGERYPLIASHGGIGVPGEVYGAERALAPEHAQAIADRGGVVGLGSQGSAYDVTPLLVARSAPVFLWQQAMPQTICLTRTSGAVPTTCEVPLRVAGPGDGVEDASDSNPILRSIAITVSGAPTTGTMQVARAVLHHPCATYPCAARSGVPTQIEAPIVCSDGACSARLDLPTMIPAASLAPAALRQCASPAPSLPAEFRLSDLGSVTIAGDDRCTDASSTWAITSATVRINDDSSAAGLIATVPSVTGPAAQPYAIAGDRQQLALYERTDHRWPSIGAPAGSTLVRVRVRPTSGTSDLPGAGIARRGSNVCVALLGTATTCASETCACDRLLVPTGAVRGECAPGWFSVNQRGVWQAVAPQDAFVNVASSDLATLCGLQLSVVDTSIPSLAWSVDEVRVERISDPVLEWRDDYIRVQRDIFAGRPGHIAFGTDINGFAPQFPISGVRPTWPPAYASRECGADRRLDELVVRSAGGQTRPVRLDERGLASFGMLSDVVAAIHQADPTAAQPVIDSLMLSAERTIRVWERARMLAGSDPTAPIVPCLEDR